MTRDEALTIAWKHDPDACWVTDEPDDNCLLVMPHAVPFLLDRDPRAYEDPNPPGSIAQHTRIVFPHFEGLT